jgi:hypothetical protein
VKSQITNTIPPKERLYIPQQDQLSDVNRIAEKQKLKTPASELISQTDVYIENESEYDIINELKRDILIKDDGKTENGDSKLNTWGNITSPSIDGASLNLINGAKLYNILLFFIKYFYFMYFYQFI